MKRIVNAVCRFIKRVIRELYLFFLGIISCFSNANQKTYFPELKRKCYLRRVFNGIGWAFTRRTHNKFYTAYGFDICGKFVNKKEYVDENKFWLELKKDNPVNKYSQIPLLRDKFCFFMYLSGAKIPTPKVFAMKFNGIYRGGDKFELIDDSFFKDKKDYFVKDAGGQCASLVKRIKDYNDFLEIKKVIEKDNVDCIFQEKLEQHPEINRLNAESVNTLRIVTINDKKSIRVFSSVIRIGTKQTGSVDNWAKGGYAVGVNDDGTLKKYGFKKPGYWSKSSEHQDSKVVFEGFQIPFYKEACELCIKAHSLFYTLGSIGWDVAITKDGPVLIEGNENFEISLIQVGNGGLKKQWDEHITLMHERNTHKFG